MDVIIIYDSKTGNTAKAAEEICEGVKASGAVAMMKKAEEATMSDLKEPKGIVLGSYCMLDKAPPAMRKFIEKQMSGADLEGKVGAVFGSYKKTGKHLPKLEGALMDKKVNIVCDGVNALGSPDAQTVKQLRDLGKKVGEESIK